MEMLRTTPKPPIGLAFEISDLLLLQDWASLHDVRLAVELDHWVEGEEYEEVVALYAKGSPLRRCILWRSAGDIVVQALIGRTRRFASVASALEGLPVTRPDNPEGGPLVPKPARRPRRSTGRAAAPRRARPAPVVADAAAATAIVPPSIR
jgi:hypothetical protein